MARQRHVRISIHVSEGEREENNGVVWISHVVRSDAELLDLTDPTRAELDAAYEQLVEATSPLKSVFE